MDGRPTDAAPAMLPCRLPATADDGAHGQVASNHAYEATLSSAALEHNPGPGTQCAHTNDLNAGQQAKSRDMLEEYYAMEMAEAQAAATLLDLTGEMVNVKNTINASQLGAMHLRCYHRPRELARRRCQGLRRNQG